MKQVTRNRRAFTLIELLVVVLIVGILAAVALPQYKLAVAKSRVATILPLLDSIRQAQEVYYLANGEYTTKGENLDIQVPGNCTEQNSGVDYFCGSHFSIDGLANRSTKKYSANAYYCPGKNQTWEDCSPAMDFKIEYRYSHNVEDPNTRMCSVKNSSQLGESICKTLSGKGTADLGTTGYYF